MNAIINPQDYFSKIPENPVLHDYVVAIKALQAAISSSAEIIILPATQYLPPERGPRTEIIVASVADIRIRQPDCDPPALAAAAGLTDLHACDELFKLLLKPGNVLIVNGKEFEIECNARAQEISPNNGQFCFTNPTETYRRLTPKSQRTRGRPFRFG